MLKKEGRLSEKITSQYLREVISAVEYLHSLDPPIIHRDIKPENILLDANDSVKLADFGWSNFFNQERRRETYCGTPEYLAPEMIKQSGHDKSLDIWNIGVLFFELLTGKPPFEGSNQNELFDNILNFRVNWPKGFSATAKDLVTKLLKSDPKQRMQLEDIINHPWFKNNPPLRPVLTKEVDPTAPPKVIDPNKPVSKGDYGIVSKPSMANKEGAINRTSISKKIDNLNLEEKKIAENKKDQ